MADDEALKAEVARLRQELDEEVRSSCEIFGRAALALDRAGVPVVIPENTDPLDALAARIRWLSSQRPIAPAPRAVTLARAIAIGEVERDPDHTMPPIWVGITDRSTMTIGVDQGAAEGDRTVVTELERVCGCRPRVHRRGEVCPNSYLTRRLGAP